jgi:RimJ/RimL family protein N-acetyltransferase
MPGPTFLRGDRLTLRTVEREDLALYQRLRNDPEVGTALGLHVPVTADQVERDYFEERVLGDDTITLLACVDDDRPIGVVHLALGRVQVVSGYGEMGIWLLPEYHGEGYGTEASATVIDYAFDELRLHRVLARAIATNAASCRVWEKLGFTEEGVHRDEFFKDGAFVDVVYYGLLEDEWEGE